MENHLMLVLIFKRIVEKQGIEWKICFKISGSANHIRLSQISGIQNYIDKRSDSYDIFIQYFILRLLQYQFCIWCRYTHFTHSVLNRLLLANNGFLSFEYYSIPAGKRRNCPQRETVPYHSSAADIYSAENVMLTAALTISFAAWTTVPESFADSTISIPLA